MPSSPSVTKQPHFSRWASMINRRNKPAARIAIFDEGRVFSVCKEWDLPKETGFSAFAKWVKATLKASKLPESTPFQLKQLNTQKPYGPTNCYLHIVKIKSTNVRKQRPSPKAKEANRFSTDAVSSMENIFNPRPVESQEDIPPQNISDSPIAQLEAVFAH